MHDSSRNQIRSKTVIPKSGHGEAQIFLMLEMLTFNPTPEEIVQALVVNYLTHHGVQKARLSLLSNDDSLHHIGAYGFKDFGAGLIESAEQWRYSLDREDTPIGNILNEDFVGFDPMKRILIASLRENGVSKGSLILVFKEPVTSEEHEAEILYEVTMISRLLSFYLLPRHKEIVQGAAAIRRNNISVSRGDFTARQLQILQGMIDGKTNHELASDLGYSVSTIRHETMRIFQILSVSDRREAARTALERSIF